MFTFTASSSTYLVVFMVVGMGICDLQPNPTHPIQRLLGSYIQNLKHLILINYLKGISYWEEVRLFRVCGAFMVVAVSMCCSVIVEIKEI